MMQDALARNMRVLRAERGINLGEAEELTGVTRETITALEHGQRGAYTKTLRKIAHGYGVTLGDLLSEVSVVGKAEASTTGQQISGGEYRQVIARYEYDKDNWAWAWGDARDKARETRELYDVFVPGTGIGILDDGEALTVYVIFGNSPSAPASSKKKTRVRRGSK